MKDGENTYDQEWERLERLERGEGSVEDGVGAPNASDDEGLPPAEEEPEASSTQNSSVTDPPNKEDGGDQIKSKKYGSIASMEKALDDTKRYAHKLEAEKAELARQLAEVQKGNATQADVDKATQAVKNAQSDLDAIKARVYEDYPELQQLIDPILDRNRELETKVISLEDAQTKIIEDDRKKALLNNFNQNVKPKVIEVHKDFDEIMQSERYWLWAERQRPALKTAALDSPDPDDIIWAVSEFKKSVAAQQIPGIRDKENNNRGTRLKNAQTLRGSSLSFPQGTSKEVDPNDYDAGWEQAEETLRKQGIYSG
jgi:hypothetical protein